MRQDDILAAVMEENSSKPSGIWSKVTSILPRTNKAEPAPNVQIDVAHPSQKNKSSDSDYHLSSLKSKLSNSIGSFIKLGPTSKTTDSNMHDGDDEVQFRDDYITPNDNASSRGEIFKNTHELLQSNTVLEDAIQEIHVNKGGKTYGRKPGRKRQLTDEDNGQNKFPKITVSCPLCNRQFPQDKIETHAADCNGPVDDDNSRGSSNGEQEILDGRNVVASTSGTPRPDLSRVYRKTDEEIDFEIEDGSDMEAPRKSDFTCYLCDKICRNQKIFDLHVEKCLAEAKQIQHQMDTKGMKTVQELDGSITPRSTRSAKVTNSSTEG